MTKSVVRAATDRKNIVGISQHAISDRKASKYLPSEAKGRVGWHTGASIAITFQSSTL